MRHKTRISIPSERNIFQRINYSFIAQYIGPVILLLIAGMSLVLAQWAWLNRRGESFSVGSPAPETYRVISHMRYDDQDSARTLRSMVSDSVVSVTVRDVSAKTRLQRRLEALSELKAGDIGSSGLSTYLARLPEPLLRAIANLSGTDRARIINAAYQVGSAYIDRVESGNIISGESAASSALWDEINDKVSSISDANLVYQILSGLGNLNYRVDAELTALARRAAANDVPEIDRRLEPGDVIVTKGEIVTAQTAVLLRLQGYTEDVFPSAQLYIVIACVIGLPLWLDILRHGAGDRRTTWWCVVLVIIIAWVFEVLAAMLGVTGAGTLPAVAFAYLCVPDYLAFCISLIATASGVFVIAGQPISKIILVAAMSLVSVTFGFYTLRNLESRRQVARRVFAMASIIVFARVLVRLVQGSVPVHIRLFVPVDEFWVEAGLFFVFDVLATHITLMVLPMVEEHIGVLSIMTLREVSYPSSHLLRELQRNAPGTYQHCVTIATLIEAVGANMGMDVNLLRAGAYYHDIGKLRRPQFFVENQGGGVNIHDDMSPMLSAITIISHVKDGLEMAYEARLPKRIRDFIAEHHGTTCTRYFYNKALAEGQKVERDDFCYPGPEPRSRETALLMIVDSVEAAVRAANVREVQSDSKGQAPNMIQKIVEQVVNSKINEKQFDHVNFTLRDLTTIKETLVSVLMSMYHTRKVKKIEKKN